MAGHTDGVATLSSRIGLVAISALLLLTGCTGSTASPPTGDAMRSDQSTAAPATTRLTPTATSASTGYPLAAPGPYAVGMRSLPTVEDTSRDGRAVRIRVWYPSVRGAVASPEPEFVPDATPDPGGGPYPVILSSSKVATELAPYLVSHGFAWVSVDGIDSYARMNLEMIDQPRDILFALDHVAANPPEGLEAMLDASRAGAIGYSFDGYNALALSGARIDSAYYLANCPEPDATTATVTGDLSAFDCGPSAAWNEYVARAGPAIAPGDDGLWRPLTDGRILAVMPMAGEGWWLFGERGLAAVDRPVLMLAATGDSLYRENALIFDHLGTPARTFISFVGPDHMMIFDRPMVERMAHFAAAFFGHHLQGRDDLASLYAEEFVARQDGLAWGTVPDR